MKILIIEDDKGTAEILRKRLKENAHVVDLSYDGKDGSFMARSFEYDIIILDYILPLKDGLVVLKEIRDAEKKMPIIFLSVKDETDMKVRALENGADDYLSKPFSFNELRARINALTRRPMDISKEILSIGDLRLNTKTYEVFRGLRRIRLTRKEYSLLEYFMRNRGIILTRSQILEHVWSVDCDPFSNTVETHLMNLRKKIGHNKKSNLIVNIPGRGYLIDDLNGKLWLSK
jgi:DNA-binding response OmpR family regulator